MDPTTQELDDFYEEVPIFDDEDEIVTRKELSLSRIKKQNRAQELYRKAQKSKVGSTIQCPYCTKSIKKTTYHKVFCSNYRTAKGPNNCKDRFWNLIRT